MKIKLELIIESTFPNNLILYGHLPNGMNKLETFEEQVLDLLSASGLGTDRSGVLAAGPEMAGYQSIFRFAGFCMGETGC